MRRIIGIHGTVALGLVTLASAACYADDKKDVTPGPIDSISDLQDTAKIVFKVADTNNDGQISQKEAVDAGNLLVGGFFFRADTNGDGVLTEQEGQQARESLFAQQPLLKFVLERAKPTNLPQGNQAQNVQPIAAGEVLTTTNIRHQAAPFHPQAAKYQWSRPDVSRWSNTRFSGYRRNDGQVGTRSYWLVVPLVFCENKNIQVLKQAFEEELGFAPPQLYRQQVAELAQPGLGLTPRRLQRRYAAPG